MWSRRVPRLISRRCAGIFLLGVCMGYANCYLVQLKILFTPSSRRSSGDGEIDSLKCHLLINGDLNYTLQLTKHRVRLARVEEGGVMAQPLSRNCDAVRSRRYFPAQPGSHMEQRFPIAFARVVYQDYLVQEMLLAAMYAPQNTYCYVVDAKSHDSFQYSMHSLAHCFSNVFVLIEQSPLVFDSKGRNMTRAHLACMRLALRNAPDWRYLITLENDDIPLKTNAEMVQILTALNGSNDIEVSRPNAKRIPPGFDWHFSTLQLLRKANYTDHEFKFAKSAVQTSLSRAFVEFLCSELNLDILLRRLDLSFELANEIFYPSIDADERLNAPGGFTRECLDEQGVETSQITRYTSWEDGRSTCLSGHYRHSICVFGVEDLPHLQSRQELFVNKLMADFDFAAIACQLQHLLRKRSTQSPAHVAFSVDAYRNRTRVRYHNQKKHAAEAIEQPFGC